MCRPSFQWMPERKRGGHRWKQDIVKDKWLYSVCPEEFMHSFSSWRKYAPVFIILNERRLTSKNYIPLRCFFILLGHLETFSFIAAQFYGKKFHISAFLLKEYGNKTRRESVLPIILGLGRSFKLFLAIFKQFCPGLKGKKAYSSRQQVGQKMLDCWRFNNSVE